jgi:hypothetical protein
MAKKKQKETEKDIVLRLHDLVDCLERSGSLTMELHDTICDAVDYIEHMRERIDELLFEKDIRNAFKEKQNG